MPSDMTARSTNDFSDAFLMPGFTYSDYDTDVHFTTISQGVVPDGVFGCRDQCRYG